MQADAHPHFYGNNTLTWLLLKIMPVSGSNPLHSL
jgi:hypothetical protein